MKLTLQLKLIPTADQHRALLETLHAFNAAASYAAEVGFREHVFNQQSIHKRCYRELRDRFGAWPEPTERLLRLAELRLLASRWQIANIHLEEVFDKSAGPKDAVLGYRSARKIKQLAEQSGGRLRVVDNVSAYLRLAPAETEPDALYAILKDLLRLPTPSL